MSELDNSSNGIYSFLETPRPEVAPSLRSGHYSLGPLGLNCVDLLDSVSIIYHTISIQAPATLSLRCERNTALILAAQGGRTTTVKLLIETGTDVSIRNVVS